MKRASRSTRSTIEQQEFPDSGSRSVSPEEPKNIFDLVTEWQGASYDGPRGTLPGWTPEVIVDRFGTAQFSIGGEILNGRLSLSEALSRLNYFIKRKRLLRLQDECLDLLRHDDALKIDKLVRDLKPPQPSKLDDVMEGLAELHEDLKLGRDACLNLWLGKNIAWNNLMGEAQRERSAEAGRKSGEVRREDSYHDRILNCAESLRAAHEPRRGLAAKIKRDGEFSQSIRQINRILKEGNIE